MLRDVVKAHLPGCVMIATYGKPNFTLLGSGFLCSDKGYFLTCAHTLDITKPLYITTPPDPNSFPTIQGNKFPFTEVDVVQYDPLNDIALLKLKLAPSTIVACPPPSVIFGDERSIDIGTTICYFGFPFAFNIPKVSQSVVSAKISTEQGTRNLMLDTAANDKNSGGQLVDVSTNKIIGIVSGRFSPSGTQPAAWIGGTAMGQDSNVSFAVGISYALDLLKAEGIYE
ncbi:serine protease [Pseudomonas sp. PvP028]|uniref:S1 family peptidase n=1 Tax=unclassified Pseudomonas TaxID=196821 RepID=UPI001AE5CE58|nr:serine protease [Pseudomonas sp. PvP028]MBP1119862.1 serine protease Do [Pseudomonas sp. PvP028]